jgi:hypothetical protein
MAAAKRDQATVRDLTPALVRIPSRAAIDPYDRVIDQLSDWMGKPRLDHPLLRDATGAVVGVTTEFRGSTRVRGGYSMPAYFQGPDAPHNISGVMISYPEWTNF